MLGRLQETLRIHAARTRALLADFRSNTRGNIAIITAVSALPVIAAIGCVVDYSMASMIKTKLQAGADAATLATVSINSTVVSTAKSMSGNGTVSNGSTYALNFFNADVAATTNYANLNVTPTATVSKSGTNITATVSFTAQVPTYFMGILGYRNVSISGTSTASYTLPAYIDFYLMLDVSGSMGFPSTSGEQQRLQAVNPDNYTNYPSGCTFACHFQNQGGCSSSTELSNVPPWPYSRTYNNGGGYCQGFTISRLGTTPASCTSSTNCNNITTSSINWSNSLVNSCSTAGTTSCIQLRLDAVGYAVSQLLATAYTTETNDQLSNQFRVGLYPFIQNLCTSSSCAFPLTSSISTGSSIYTWAAQLANWLDTGQNSTLGSGGTHFENAIPSMNSLISSVGTGTSSSNTLPYVFLITDGSQDYQTYWNGNWSGTASDPYANSATTMPPNSVDTHNYCTTLKNRGITIAILYIPYQTIQNPNSSFANNEDGYANSNIANIPASLAACASPNFFYTASSPTAITNALVTMFEQAVSTAHITQ
jgi:Flp pilus assembly protein TadG